MTATATPRPTSGRGVAPVSGELRPGSYERISHFTEGRTGAEVKRGVDRQFDDACKAAKVLGLPVPDRYTDNDQSASDFATKPRERWPEFLEDIRTGRINRPMFWLFDRAFRTTEASDAFIRACREGGALIVQTGGWAPVVANPHDPMDVKRMKDSANQAEYEVAVMSMRARRHKEAMREAGVTNGGPRRFGYEHDMTVRESEAAIVRDVVDRFLAGESLRSLAAWMNANGVETVTAETRRAKGKPVALWTQSNLRQTIGREYLAGQLVHKGQVIKTDAWTPVLPPETLVQVRATLADPARRPAGSGNARRWLLSGLAKCATCGAGLVVRTHSGPHPSYACPTGRHVHRRVDLVDRVVELAVVGRLARYDASGLLMDDAAGAELVRLRDARAVVEEQMEAYEAEAGSMPAKAYAAATTKFHADLEALDDQIGAVAVRAEQAPRILAGAAGPEAEARWFGTEETPGWDLARRRAIIAALCTVELRGGRGNNTGKGAAFNPRDVDVDFELG